MKKKAVWIIIIVIIILLILAVALFFILSKSKGFSFGFNGFDFSSATKALSSIGEAANRNTFENAKLNPFVNGTG